MNSTDYHRQALSTSVAHATPAHRVLNAALGLAGEAGGVAGEVSLRLDGDRLAHTTLWAVVALAQIAEHVKKVRFHGKALDAGMLRERLTSLRYDLQRLEEAFEGEYLHGPQPADAFTLGGPDEGGPAGLGCRGAAVADEAGDVLWYLAQLADGMGLTLADVAEGNVAKLSRRWPAGFVQESRS